MSQLCLIAIHNVALVLILVPVVWGITRVWKNPPGAHVLWLLLLVKLVTPPVLQFEVANWIWNASSVDTTRRADSSLPAFPIPSGTPQISGDNSLSPGIVSNPSLVSDARENSSRVPPESLPAATPEGFQFNIASLGNASLSVLMWCWGVGIALVSGLATIRVIRLQRLLSGTLPASQRIQTLTDGLAVELSLRQAPEVRVVDSSAAPFVWCLGRRATVVLPQRFLGTLSENQIAMVLAHELAHLHRRDHWVRALELIVSVLYWWNPLVWWVRRQLHAAEEQCCDAWVLWVYPDRSYDYAQSLFAAADLLPRSSFPPVLVSPFLNPPTLKERIAMVLQNRCERSVSRRAVVSIMLVAAWIIPAGLRGVAQEQARPQAGQAGSSRTTTPTAVAPDEPMAKPVPAESPAKVDTTPIPRHLLPFQGRWVFETYKSLKWPAAADEARTWAWEIQRDQITWTRPGQEPLQLSFSVADDFVRDPKRWPNDIEFTVLSGPDKGEKCLGAFYWFADSETVWFCFQDPGSKSARPKKMGFNGHDRLTMIAMHPAPTAAVTDSVAQPAAIPVSVDETGRPLAAPWQELQGAWNFGACESVLWSAPLEQIRQSWKWVIQGREISWIRDGQPTVRLSYSIDPTKAPNQIDVTWLDGPHQGQKSLGIYEFERNGLWLCLTEPGAKVGRPSQMSMSGSSQTALIILQDRQSPPRVPTVAEEQQALQGKWKFDLYYSNWWPERISNPPITWKPWRWTITGNEITWTGLKIDDVKLSYRLDPSKTPRQIELTILDGEHKGLKLSGIYRFKAGGWSICFADPAAKVTRPTEFSFSYPGEQTWAEMEPVPLEPPVVVPAAAPAAAVPQTMERKAEIDAAIDRLRKRGAFVREFHPRGDPQYWVQVISTGVGDMSQERSDNFDDAAMSDVEIIARKASLELHLRNSSMTTTGLERLASAGEITMLELSGANVHDGMVKLLPKLPLRGSLSLNSDRLTDAGIKPIAECPGLTHVGLSGVLLTNDSLDALTGLPKLEGVSLGENFSRGALSILARIPSLTRLDASALNPALDDLKQLTNLRILNLSGKEYGDQEALAIAESFPSLEQAYLLRTSITNAGVKHLARLEKLKILTLDHSRVDDGVAESIRAMKNLEWLSVGDCAVGDETVAAISEHASLRYLFLVNTRVTNAGVAHLAKVKKPFALYLFGCRLLTDDCIKSLAQLPNDPSMNLSLLPSGITVEGVRQLRKALPKAQIR